MHRIITQHWIRHLTVLIVLIILVNLGRWQLRRLDERRDFNQTIVTGLNQPPAVLTSRPIDPNSFHIRRVSVTGRFDNDQSIVLRGRTLNNRQGVEMVVPLRIAGSEQAVLVNRGWIPLENSEREARRQYDLTDEITLTGIAYRTQTRPDTAIAPTDPPLDPVTGRLDVWFRVDIDRIQVQLTDPLLPIFVEVSPTDEATTPPIAIEKIELSDGPHLGYAIQWFAFGLILVIIYGVLLRQEWKNRDP